MDDKFGAIVRIIILPAFYFFFIKGVIPFLESISDRASAKNAEIEKQRREAIRRAEEREKERQIQEAKRQNPWYPGQYLGHVNYNDNKKMQDILKEIEAKGEWPNNPKK